VHGDPDVFRLGVLLTQVVVIVTVLVEIPWWHLAGLIK
jgi:hypothetical protein